MLEQIQTILKRSLTTDEAELLPLLAEEAAALLGGYLSKEVSPSQPEPAVVGTVLRRIVVRALQAQDTSQDVQSDTQATGPFQRTVTYTPQSRTGSAVYLTAADKVMLQQVKASVVSVPLVRG